MRPSLSTYLIIYPVSFVNDIDADVMLVLLDKYQTISEQR